MTDSSIQVTIGEYGEPMEPGWYFIEIDGVAKPRRVGRLNDGRIYCPDVAMANGATVRFGPRIPEDWGECWNLGRAQDLRRQAEETCARRTTERDEAIAALRRQAEAVAALETSKRKIARLTEERDQLAYALSRDDRGRWGTVIRGESIEAWAERSAIAMADRIVQLQGGECCGSASVNLQESTTQASGQDADDRTQDGHGHG